MLSGVATISRVIYNQRLRRKERVEGCIRDTPDDGHDPPSHEEIKKGCGIQKY